MLGELDFLTPRSARDSSLGRNAMELPSRFKGSNRMASVCEPSTRGEDVLGLGEGTRGPVHGTARPRWRRVMKVVAHETAIRSGQRQPHAARRKNLVLETVTGTGNGGGKACRTPSASPQARRGDRSASTSLR